MPTTEFRSNKVENSDHGFTTEHLRRIYITYRVVRTVPILIIVKLPTPQSLESPPAYPAAQYSIRSNIFRVLQTETATKFNQIYYCIKMFIYRNGCSLHFILIEGNYHKTKSKCS